MVNHGFGLRQNTVSQRRVNDERVHRVYGTRVTVGCFRSTTADGWGQFDSRHKVRPTLKLRLRWVVEMLFDANDSCHIEKVRVSGCV